MPDSSDSEDEPCLSAAAQAALSEFYAEQKEQQQEQQQQQPAEDWNMSQFWYDQPTCDTLANEIQALSAAAPAASKPTVAMLSCPTLYVHIVENRQALADACTLRILEYDERFSCYPDFVAYDYTQPLQLPPDLLGACDIVIADPPFLTEECLVKFSESVRSLLKCDGRLLLCTGACQQELANQCLQAVKRQFVPQHKSKLANEFACFTNYQPITFL